uniref:Tify domain-containing protein n=1 Tax=Manihot esculenta TaxID=3983 RepID=A0A2C9W795_MANES
MALLLIMAQQGKAYNANTTLSISACISLLNSSTTKHHRHHHQLKAMFHDFLGLKPPTIDSPVVLASKNADASPSASISVGAASSGGARAPLSTTSDLASERQVGNHLEGIPYYGPRSDISCSEISNRLAGSKRSNSDTAFTGTSRDGIQQMGHDSLESLHLMKMLKNGGGGERPRRSNDDEVFYGMQTMRPTSSSLILQSSSVGRLDANVSKWERSIPMGSAIQYPPRAVPANKFRDINAGPSIISQSAADEGSRTGIKGPGILSSINAGSVVSEKNSSGALPSGSKPKSGTHISEPESSTPGRQGLTSASRQMTIFYGGQAHVFDDVHPNKNTRNKSCTNIQPNKATWTSLLVAQKQNNEVKGRLKGMKCPTFNKRSITTSIRSTPFDFSNPEIKSLEMSFNIADGIGREIVLRICGSGK